MIDGSTSKLTFTLREEIAAEGRRRKDSMDKLLEQLTNEVRNEPETFLLRFHLHVPSLQINDTVQLTVLEVRNSLEVRFAEQPDKLDAAKKLLSSEVRCACCHEELGGHRLSLQQINDLREGQNQVSETVRKMLDEVREKQHVRSFKAALC